MWQEIENNNEAMCYEKRNKDIYVRLEARQNDEEWTVYRGFCTSDNLNYTEQYSVMSREEARSMLLRLKKEKLPSTDEINELVKNRNKKVYLNMKRAYKDDMVEKWFFTVNDELIQNFFIVKEFEKIEMDVVMHEKYRIKSKDIVRQIRSFLSYEDVFVDIEQNLYYFSRNENQTSSKNILEQYDVELGFKK